MLHNNRKDQQLPAPNKQSKTCSSNSYKSLPIPWPPSSNLICTRHPFNIITHSIMFEAPVITLPVSTVSLPIRRNTQADSECYHGGLLIEWCSYDWSLGLIPRASVGLSCFWHVEWSWARRRGCLKLRQICGKLHFDDKITVPTDFKSLMNVFRI